MGMSIRVAARAALSLGAVGLAGGAQAGGFINQSQSAVFNGSAYAGYAAPGSSPSSMFLNPAVITAFSRITTENNFSLVMPNTKIDGVGLLGGKGSGDIGQDSLTPASYAVVPLSDRLFLGVAFNAPFGLTTKPDIPWGGQVNSLTTKARTYNLTPSLAYKVSDSVSVGFGLQIQYFDAKYLAAAGLGATPPVAGFEGDGWGFGAVAGLTWTPAAGTSFGLGYRSRIDQTIEGKYVGLLFTGQTLKSTIRLPDRVNLSLRQTVSKDLDLLASIEWQGWGRIGTSALKGVGVSPSLPGLPFEYKDGWFFALGGEHRWSPALVLRAGVAYELSPVTDRVRTTRLPDNNRTWLSAGFSYELNDRFTINASYSHVLIKDAPIAIAAAGSTPPYTGASKAFVDIVSLGVTSRWGAAAPGVLAARY